MLFGPHSQKVSTFAEFVPTEGDSFAPLSAPLPEAADARQPSRCSSQGQRRSAPDHIAEYFAPVGAQLGPRPSRLVPPGNSVAMVVRLEPVADRGGRLRQLLTRFLFAAVGQEKGEPDGYGRNRSRGPKRNLQDEEIGRENG